MTLLTDHISHCGSLSLELCSFCTGTFLSLTSCGWLTAYCTARNFEQFFQSSTAMKTSAQSNLVNVGSLVVAQTAVGGKIPRSWRLKLPLLARDLDPFTWFLGPTRSVRPFFHSTHVPTDTQTDTATSVAIVHR